MRLLHLIAVAVLITAVGAAQDLVPFAQGLDAPLFMTHAGDNSGRLFIVERPGRIRIWRSGQVQSQPFLDISQRVRTDGEFGLLGLAFHPNFESNRRFFVYYAPSSGSQRTLVVEFQSSVGNPDLAVDSETVLLTIPQPARNHNGGMMAFGPDGMLYVGLGDGGGGGDPFENAQDLTTIQGSVIRLDVDGPSLIPPDNPFVGMAGARGEIWAYGLRNPWRFSFDRGTGRLFLGDVGQASFEEVDIIEGGNNYGWDIMEASSCFEPPSGCDMSGLTLPIHEYGRDDGRSITGGYVYRGQRFSSLQGRYIFGDFVSGRIWTLRQLNNGTWTRSLLFNRPDILLASFAEDAQGELYVVDLSGRIFELAREDPDLALDKSHVGTFRVGEIGEYRLLVRNEGALESGTPITLSDSLPDGLSLDRIEAADWNCSNDGPDITCTRQQALLPDAETLISIFVEVEASAVPEVVNSATVQSPGDLNPNNNVDSEPTTVVGQVDLLVEAEADQPFVAGFEASYDITVRNVGQVAALQPVELSIELPPTVTPVDAEGNDWDCQIQSTAVLCDLDTPFVLGDEASLLLRVLIDPQAPPTVEALFQLESSEDDIADNDSLTLQTPVSQPANLAMQARLDNPLRPGMQAQLRVSLTGQTVAGVGARITEELPQGMTFVTSQGQGWRCQSLGVTVVCQHPESIQAPDPQQPEELLLTLQVSPLAGGGLRVNRVLLEAEFDTLAQDNESIQTVVVAEDGDSDGDGVPDLEEDVVWPQGDGNGDGVPDRLQSSVASLMTPQDVPVAIITRGDALALVSVQETVELEDLQLSGVQNPVGAFDFTVLESSSGEAGRSGVFVVSDRSLGNHALLFGQFFIQIDFPEWTELPFPRPAGEEGAEIGTHSIFLALADGGTFDADSQQDGVISVRDWAAGFRENAPRIRFFPQVGDGTLQPVRFQTEINLLNRGSQVMARLDLRESSSLAMPLPLIQSGPRSQLDIPLAAGGTFAVQSDGSGDPDDSSLLVGSARLVASPSVEAVLVFRRSDAERDVILYEAGIPATRPLREATVFVDSLGARQTGIAVLNPPEIIPPQGDDFLIPQVPALSAEVRLELRTLDFQLLAETSFTLADGEQRAAFLEELFDQSMPSPAPDLQGLLVIRSDRPLAVLGLRQTDQPDSEFPDDVATLAPIPVAEGVFRPVDQ
ncbi:MAG TPA: PQQ-dependent sugar dehydrogenase [Acidobacteriota bacterium]|nr:PQQ-dependent sugar dehydrogenase [Acidobacteriota bacterium]